LLAAWRAAALTSARRIERAFMADIPIGVVTISDRASRGVYEDKGGPGIEAALTDLLASPWRPERRLVPDERPAIEAALIALADVARCPRRPRPSATASCPASAN
jgi:molybdopterin biosynthesis enzyme MoaB